jgi:hypothetical protein
LKQETSNGCNAYDVWDGNVIMSNPISLVLLLLGWHGYHAHPKLTNVYWWMTPHLELFFFLSNLTSTSKPSNLNSNYLVSLVDSHFLKL